MELKDLILKLQALNPEAEVYLGPEGSTEGMPPLECLEGATPWKRYGDGSADVIFTGKPATPSDTLIVLSE